MTYLEGADYFVRLVDLPTGINGLVSPNEDGTYNIFLPVGADHEKQIDSYFHELRHIEDCDFYNGKSIEEIEGL